MGKLGFMLLCLFGMGVLQAQEVLQPEPPKVWTTKGNFSVLFNQSTFTNWYVGGENNVSGNLGFNYDFNYKKGDWTWDNKLLAFYGLVKTKNTPFEKKTDDRFEYNALLGKKATENWYYSAFLNCRTQMTNGYVYSRDANGAEIRTKTTTIMSPGYLTFGPGMLWKKNNNLKFNVAPLTSKITIVNPSNTLPNAAYFGVSEGKSLRYELGLYASGYYKFHLMANVSLENMLNLYANYLAQAGNLDIDYQLNVVLKINRYLSTNISLQAVYDENAFSGFQTRQVMGLGFNLGF